MVVAFATEKQTWSDADLDTLRQHIREGDLTTVLEVYEGDIKTPVRSAVSGTLIRSLLIQVQKAKVRLDSYIPRSCFYAATNTEIYRRSTLI